MSVAFNECDPFVLRGDDVIAFEEHMHRLGWPMPVEPNKRGLIVSSFGFLSLFGLWGFISVNPSSGITSRTLLALAGFSLAVLSIQVLLYVISVRQWRRLKKDRPRLALAGYLSAWQVTITPEAIWYENEGDASFHRWSTIWDIYGTTEHAFIWTNAREVVLVPRRAFTSEAKFTDFVRQAAQYCREDESSSPPATINGRPRSGICLIQQAITDRHAEQGDRVSDKEPLQDHP
jgi:hypothetical protein